MNSQTTMILLGVAAAAGIAYWFFLRKPGRKESYERSVLSNGKVLLGGGGVSDGFSAKSGAYEVSQVDYAYRPEANPHLQADPADKRIPLEVSGGADLYDRPRDTYFIPMADSSATRSMLLRAGDYGVWRELTGMPGEGVEMGANVEAAYAYDDGHPMLYQ